MFHNLVFLFNLNDPGFWLGDHNCNLYHWFRPRFILADLQTKLKHLYINVVELCIILSLSDSEPETNFPATSAYHRYRKEIICTQVAHTIYIL